MKLYHGSNVKVVTPLIRSNLRALDFGPGFYLTTSRKQATTWAKSVTRRRRNGSPTLNIYFIYGMYEIYHTERLQNAFDDIDELILENQNKGSHL